MKNISKSDKILVFIFFNLFLLIIVSAFLITETKQNKNSFISGRVIEGDIEIKEIITYQNENQATQSISCEEQYKNCNGGCSNNPPVNVCKDKCARKYLECK